MKFPFLFRGSRFRRALEAYGLKKCSLSSTSKNLLVGLPAHKNYAREPLTKAPDALESVCFFEAPAQADLIAALALSIEAKTLKHLFIGTSHEWAHKTLKQRRANAYDMSGAIAALRDSHMPMLERLSLGDMEQLYNGHRLMGTIGDITPIFAMAPRLKDLTLCGYFELTRPIRHDMLHSIDAQQAEIGISGGPPSQVTVSNLLSSHLPALATMILDLDEGGDEQDLELPDDFFSGDGFAGLRTFEMDRLTPASALRLEAWKAARQGL